MCNQSLFKWWRKLHYWQNNSQRQFEHRNLMQTFENLLLQNYSTKFLDIIYKYSLRCVIKVCSNDGVAYIIGEIIAKDNLNIENLMQTFKNLLLQNCSTKFLDIAHK